MQEFTIIQYSLVYPENCRIAKNNKDSLSYGQLSPGGLILNGTGTILTSLCNFYSASLRISFHRKSIR
ncbi:unnamed protein product, partial [Allacma fusca]